MKRKDNKPLDDANAPVTHAQFNEGMQMIANAFEKVATKDELKQFATKKELDATAQHIIDQVTKLHQKTLDHFDAVAENIHADLAGANKDEISAIQDTQKKHEQRITKVENHLEITPAV